MTPRFVFHAGAVEDLRVHFPYGVFYRPKKGRIEVLAVFHHRRDPNVWQRRAAV